MDPLNQIIHSFRSARNERGIARRFASGEAGVSLIELLIALTIFSVVASGVAVGMGSALGLTRNNRNRSVAANLAAKEMDIVRSTKFASLPLTDVTKTETVTGVNYTLLRQTSWVSKDGSGGVCSPPAGTALAFLRVIVTVTWPNMQGVRPVQSETIVSPPIGAYNSGAGHMAIMVRDRNALPSAGITVTAIGPGGTFTQITAADGCAFFIGLPPGVFNVSLNTPAFVDVQNQTNPVQPLTVSAGSITSGEFVYDRSATINMTLVGLANYGVPEGIGASVANTGLALGSQPFTSGGGGGGGTCTASPTTLLSSGDASVLQSDPNNSTYGSSSNTYAGTYSSNGGNGRFLVKFTLPTAPAGCAVATATLRIYDRVPSSGRTIQAYQANSSWTEGSTNWNNQPTTTGTAVTATAPSSAGWMTWGVTSIVQAQYAGANNGFLLRDATENGSDYLNQFDVRELANDPELVVTWGNVSACSTQVTVGASDDARVRQEKANENFGDEKEMKVVSRTDDKNERIFIRFTLPTVPTGCALGGAELRLYQDKGKLGRTIEVYRAASSWLESTITWIGQPSTTGSPSTAPSSGSDDVWRTWDVGTLVNSMYQGSNNGFVIKDSNESSSSTMEQVYRSSENTTTSRRPELVVSFVESPILPTSQSVSATPLFPYLNGYQLWGGTCLDADPEGVNPSTGQAFFPGGQRASAVTTNPGTTTTASVPLKSVDVRVRLSNNTSVAGASVVAYHDPDNGCTTGRTLNLGATGSDGYVRVALPYGTWRFQVNSKTPVGSWPTSALSPTTSNPQSITVTVN